MIPTLLDLQNLAAWIVLVGVVVAVLWAVAGIFFFLTGWLSTLHRAKRNLLTFDLEARRRRQLDTLFRERSR